MPDQLFDTLTEIAPTAPPSPAEVRRRGDRRRRRQQAAVGIAGLAAVAAIAAPLAFVTGDDKTGPTPPIASQTPNQRTDVVTTIPAGFPLTDGLPGVDGVTGQAPEVGPLTTEAERACGEVVWSAQAPAPVVDGASVEYRDSSEGGQSRSIAVYGSVDAAERAVSHIRETLAACPGEDLGHGDSQQLDAVGVDAGEEAYAWVVRWRDSAGFTGEAMLSSVTRVGNALLIDSATFLGAGDDAVVQHEARRLTDRASGVVAAMEAAFGG